MTKLSGVDLTPRSWSRQSLGQKYPSLSLDLHPHVTRKTPYEETGPSTGLRINRGNIGPQGVYPLDKYDSLREHRLD